MEVKVSTKYQIVIPKDIRRKLGLKPGQKVAIHQSGDKAFTLERSPSMHELLAKSVGTMKDTPWQKTGDDAAEWLRTQRDSEWD